MPKISVVSSFTDLSGHLPEYFRRIPEAIKEEEGRRERATEEMNLANRRIDQMNDDILTSVRHAGIYEAHLRGVRAEEIAHYGDYRVEYVEEVVKLGDLTAYSRRTGNAIIFTWPGED